MVGGKLYGADAIRVIACVGVLVHHLSQAVVPMFTSPEALKMLNLVDRGKFGVSVFFVLSGFLLGIPFWKALDANGKVSIWTYALRRMARIVPAAWLCLLVSFALDALALETALPYRNIRFIAGMLFLSDWHWVTLFPVWSNGPLWSLSFEVSSYLMMPICFAAFIKIIPDSFIGWKARYIWTVAIVIALTMHGVMLVALSNEITPAAGALDTFKVARLWYPTYNPFGFFAMFAIGTLAAGIHVMLLGRRAKGDIARGLFVLVCGTVLPVSIYSFTFQKSGFALPPFAFHVLPLITAMFLVICQQVNIARRLDGRAIAFIAKISFGVYIWHALIIKIVWLTLPVNTMPPSLLLVVLGALVAIIATAIATLSYFHFEEPVMRWARRFEHPDNLNPRLS
jgi:peptidoglycan/LPS O-acetylase OafA/YrhL